jgi:KDO2-lipid IV(A) lauroyltransferase
MKLKYRITYNLLKLLSNLVQSLEPSTQFNYANKFGFVCYHFLKIRQKEARRNISIAFPKLSENKRENILKDTYRFFIYSSMQFLSLPKSVTHANISVNGEQYLHEALSKNKGVLLVSGHFGLWELLLGWFGINKYSLLLIGQKQKNVGADRFINELRKNNDIKILPRKSSLELMYSALENNDILTLASDQDAKKNGVFINFFGVKASTPKGAALFHLKSKSPIIFVTCHMKNINKYIINIRPVKIPNKSDIESITIAYTSLLENIIKKYPDQYFWFHRRWKTKPS